MKIRALFGFLLLLVLLVFFFPACQPPEEEKPDPVTVEERVSKFLNALNDDETRESIYTHLHPDVRNAWKDAATWAETPFAYAEGPFSLADMTYESTFAEGTLGALGENEGGTGIYDGEPIRFDMKEEEADVWYIKIITVADDDWIH